MFIEIESINKTSEIRHVEFSENRLVFFLFDFFHIIFEDNKEKRNFFTKFLELTKSNFSEGKSYVELSSEGLVNKSRLNNGVLEQDITNIKISSYDFTITPESLIITFYSQKDFLKIVLYKKLLTELRMNEKYILK